MGCGTGPGQVGQVRDRWDRFGTGWTGLDLGTRPEPEKDKKPATCLLVKGGLAKAASSLNQGKALVLREQVVVVRGIIGILCKVILLEGVFPRSLRWVVVTTCNLFTY